MFCDCPLVIDYILEINLTKRQKIKNGFVHFQKSYLIKIDVEETKNNLNDYHLRCLKKSKMVIDLFCCSQLPHVYALLTNALMPIKQWTVFRC